MSSEQSILRTLFKTAERGRLPLASLALLACLSYSPVCLHPPKIPLWPTPDLPNLELDDLVLHRDWWTALLTPLIIGSPSA